MMSVEYIFFNEALRDRFVQFAQDRGVAGETREDEMDGFVVRLPEDVADAVSDAIEDEYEALMNEQRILAESEEGWATRQVLGVTVTLADGRPCNVRIEGPISRRLSEHFTPEEIHTLVTAIAHSIENPVDGPLCRKA
jgi:hypothetical protein